MRTQLRNTTKVKSSTQLWRAATIGMVALVVGIAGIIWFQLGTAHTSHANNLPGYDYKKVITIQESEIPGNNALVDFPVLLHHTDADLATTSNGGYVEHSNGYDIRAALADGTELDQELEYYDPATGEIALWVRYPSLSATNDSEIHLFFGNSSVSSDPSSASTWSGNYNGVYHFAGNADDATGVYDASRNGTSTASNGLIGEGEDFDGNNDFLEIDQDAIPSNGGWTISMWVRFNSGGDDRQYLFDMRIDNGNDEFSLRYDDDDEEVRWRYMDDDENRSRNEIEEDAVFDDSEWYHLVAIGEWNGSTQELYIDGQRVGVDNSSASASPSRPRPFLIGADQRNVWYFDVRNEFDGIMDEVRILNTQLSAAWIETEYNNQNDPGSFYTIGTLQDLTSGGGGSGGGNTGNCAYTADTLTGYTHRMQLTINANHIAGNSAHADFPVWVSVTDNDLRTTGNGGQLQHANGYDIMFTSGDGLTTLDFDIEAYDAATGKLQAWVKVPSLSTNSDTKLYLYFGDSTVVNDPSSTNTWSNGYELVSHFNNNTLDQSGNGHHGNNNGTQSGSGVAAVGRDFDGNNDEITYPDIDETEGAISFWFSPSATINSSLQTSQTLLAKYDGPSDHFTFVIAGNDNNYANNSHDIDRGEVYFKVEGAGPLSVISSSTDSWLEGEWYYVTGTWGNDHRLFINGVQEVSSNDNVSLVNSANIQLGYGVVEQCGGNNRAFAGAMDEFRLSNVERSEDWVATEYNTLMESNFMTAGCVEPLVAVASNGGSCSYTDPVLDGYAYRAELTVDADIVAGNTDLIDFPLYVSLEEPEMRSMVNGGEVRSADGYDIVFTAADGSTRLHHYMLSYNPASGAFKARVRIPTLKATSNTTFYVYYGKPGVSSDPSSDSTWSERYLGVWTMDNNGLDATANNNDFTQVNGNPADVAGRIGRARSFDGINDYYIDPDAPSYLNGLSAITVSMWVQSSVSNEDRDIFYTQNVGNGGDNNLGLRYDQNGYECSESSLLKGAIRVTNSEKAFETSSNTQSTNWQHLVMSWSDGNALAIYMDGQPYSLSCFSNNDNLNGVISNTSQLVLGNGTKNQGWEGVIDEFQIANETLSAEWIETMYNNETGASSPVGCGCHQDLSGVGGGSLLPIELGYFEAQPTDDGQVALAWETLLEINNEYFTIERSKDGEHFEPILTEPGQINSSTPTQYERYDDNPLPGYSYYRLKQTDLDGKYEYFPIKQVFIAPAKDDLQITRVYPNPFRAHATVEVLAGYEQTATAQLVDGSGRVYWQSIWRLQEGEQRFAIPGTSLAKGYYLLHLSTEDGQQAAVPLLKTE